MILIITSPIKFNNGTKKLVRDVINLLCNLFEGITFKSPYLPRCS